MAEETRTRCHITVLPNAVIVDVRKSDGMVSPPVRDVLFDAKRVVAELRKMPPGDPKAYGQKLFALLFANVKVKNAFVNAEKSDPTAKMQVCIELDDDNMPDLRALRWEALYDQETPNPRPLAASDSFRLARKLSSVSSTEPLQGLLPLSDRPRVLVVISNPKNLQDCKTDTGESFEPIEGHNHGETNKLDTLMTDLKKQGLISDYRILGGGLPEPHPDGYPSPGRIREVLRDPKYGGPYNILHFLAHGYLDKAGNGYLILAKDDGTYVSLPQDQFGYLGLDALQLRLVIFATCQSDKQAIGRPLAGLAPSILQAGVNVPAVIAMQDKISVAAAFAFSNAFYKELGKNGYLDTAMYNARAAVAAATPGTDEWPIPVLYLQKENPRLFDPDVKESARQLTSTLFTTKPLDHFVNREADIRLLANLLCEQQAPIFCWRWGPQMVGKKYLLQQLRFEAFRLGYGHLAYFAQGTSSKIGESKLLYEVLNGLVIKGLENDPKRRECLAQFLRTETEEDSPIEIVTTFLDGLEEYADTLQRGLVCFMHFYDFADHEKLLTGPFRRLVGEVVDRYQQGQLNRVRFMVAVGGNRPPKPLNPEASSDFFEERELSGFDVESIKALCKSYDLVKDDQVPAQVAQLIQQSRLPSPEERYVLKWFADSLWGLSRQLGAGVLRQDELQWAPLTSGGG